MKSLNADNEKRFFDEYYLHHAYNPIAWNLRFEREKRALTQIIQAYRHDLGNVLSLGCGDGQFEILISPLCRTVLGIDISPEAILLATANATAAASSSVTFCVSSPDQLNPHEPFDTVIALAFLHHLPASEQASYLHHIHDWLRQGGLFYAQDPSSRGLLRTIGRQLMGSTYNLYHSPDERELLPGELSQALAESGFRDISIGWIDFTLIPAAYLLPAAPSWIMRLFATLDLILTQSPLAPLATGFNISAWKR